MVKTIINMGKTIIPEPETVRMMNLQIRLEIGGSGFNGSLLYAEKDMFYNNISTGLND